jgi:FixJ family two-component response regulator
VGIRSQFSRLPRAISAAAVGDSEPIPKPCSQLFHVYVMHGWRNRPVRNVPPDIISDVNRPRIPVYADAAARPAGIPPKAVFMDRANEMVYIVDDEASVGEALSTLLRANGKRVQVFTSGSDFLDFGRRDSCACLILDLRMPGLGGLEVQKLIAKKTSIPVIFLTGRGDIPSTVKAMKGGAVDFLTKPVDEDALLTTVERALRQDSVSRMEAAEHAGLVARYESLTPREREVLPLLVRGLLNKQAAYELGITEYTVQIHRGHIMRKMEADSFATLVKLAGKLQIETTGTSSGNALRALSL